MSLAKLKRSLDDEVKRLSNIGGVSFGYGGSGAVGSNLIGDREYDSATPIAFRTNFDRFHKGFAHHTNLFKQGNYNRYINSYETVDVENNNKVRGWVDLE